MDLPKITVPVSGKIALEHKFPSSQANDLSNASLQEKKKMRLSEKVYGR